MSVTHSINTIYTAPEGTVKGIKVDYVGDGAEVFSGVAAASSTTEIDIAWKRSTLKAFMIYSDVACVVKSNAADSTASDTVTLAAGQMIAWGNDHLEAKPFATADVTKLYVIVAGGTLANVIVRALNDVTP